MSQVADSGKTILFVSHNMEAIIKLCDRAVLLDHGRVAHIGTPQESVDHYLSATAKDRGFTNGKISLGADHAGRKKDHQGPVQLSYLKILQEDGEATSTVSNGREMDIILGYDFIQKNKSYNAMFVIIFSNLYNHRIVSCRSYDVCTDSLSISKSGEVMCRIPKLPFIPGVYQMTVSCNTESGNSDVVYNAATFEVVGNHFYSTGNVPTRKYGDVLVDHSWELLPENHHSSQQKDDVEVRL